MTTLRKNLLKAIACLAFIVCVPIFAQAHKVNINAALDGNIIVGRVYFTGGGVAQSVDVDVFTQDGVNVGPVKTDARGEFLFAPKQKDAQYKFVVDTGDGHAAETTVAVGGNGLLPSGQAKVYRPRPMNIAQIQKKAVNVATGEDVRTQQVGVDQSDVSAIVADELSRQLVPISQKLDEYEHRIRISDIVSGIGFIFGLAGLASLIWTQLVVMRHLRSKDNGKNEKNG